LRWQRWWCRQRRRRCAEPNDHWTAPTKAAGFEVAGRLRRIPNVPPKALLFPSPFAGMLAGGKEGDEEHRASTTPTAAAAAAASGAATTPEKEPHRDAQPDAFCDEQNIQGCQQSPSSSGHESEQSRSNKQGHVHNPAASPSPSRPRHQQHQQQFSWFQEHWHHPSRRREPLCVWCRFSTNAPAKSQSQFCRRYFRCQHYAVLGEGLEPLASVAEFG